MLRLLRGIRAPYGALVGGPAPARQGSKLWWPAALAAATLALGALLGLCQPPAVQGQGAPPSRPPVPLFLPVIPQGTFQSGGIRPSDFGLVWVNSAEKLSSATRIERGVNTGAKLDRFPLYWNLIETSAGRFNWQAQDAALAANEAQGLGTLAILLGEPGFYYPGVQAQGLGQPLPPLGGSFLRNNGGLGASAVQGVCTSGGPPAPRGLYNAIFSDGSDRPGPAKSPNPANPWAYWVGQTVDRYKPGGSAGLHVRHWEIWNEEDLCQFWTGTAAEYARLLEVAGLVIRQRDPGATVIWGGLAHYEQPQFLYDLINTLVAAPMSAEFGGFFDAAAGHHYAILWNGYEWTARVRAALNGAGWSGKPIWITESGVPVCDDYPGPACPSPWRATPIEQATWMWENVAYTRMAGGGPIFQFALYDDCGNVVAPNSPDGFGLVKNEVTSPCSPAQAQLRPAYTAYRLANRYFAGADLLWSDIEPSSTPRARRTAFYDPASKERRTLLWALDGDVTSVLPATGTQARRVALDGSETVLSPTTAGYAVSLPAPTNRNNPDGAGGYTAGIYGVPTLLIETDTQPPVTGIAALPPTVSASFPITWTVSDRGSGLAQAAIYYQKDEGPWLLWWSTVPGGDGVNAGGTRQFDGETGHHYRFAATGSDRAGNSTALSAQAETWTTGTPAARAVPGEGQIPPASASPASQPRGSKPG